MVGLCTSTSEGMSSIPGPVTLTCHEAWSEKKKNQISSDWSKCYDRNKRWRYNNREWLGGSTLR